MSNDHLKQSKTTSPKNPPEVSYNFLGWKISSDLKRIIDSARSIVGAGIVAGPAVAFAYPIQAAFTREARKKGTWRPTTIAHLTAGAWGAIKQGPGAKAGFLGVSMGIKKSLEGTELESVALPIGILACSGVETAFRYGPTVSQIYAQLRSEGVKVKTSVPRYSVLALKLMGLPFAFYVTGGNAVTLLNSELMKPKINSLFVNEGQPMSYAAIFYSMAIATFLAQPVIVPMHSYVIRLIEAASRLEEHSNQPTLSFLSTMKSEVAKMSWRLVLLRGLYKAIENGCVTVGLLYFIRETEKFFVLMDEIENRTFRRP